MAELLRAWNHRRKRHARAPAGAWRRAGRASATLVAGAGPESLVQAFLVRAQTKVRTRCLARAVGCAQEIGRVCTLPEEARTLLQIAARGAVEASLREWRVGAENNRARAGREPGGGESGCALDATRSDRKLQRLVRRLDSARQATGLGAHVEESDARPPRRPGGGLAERKKLRASSSSARRSSGSRSKTSTA